MVKKLVIPALLALAAFMVVLEFSRPTRAETGVASWYGGRDHGGPTASGARFNQDAPTCAHKTLKFGTVIKVTDLSTGLSTVCTVTDRGPFIRHRIVDLSRAGARSHGNTGRGLASVKIEVVE